MQTNPDRRLINFRMKRGLEQSVVAEYLAVELSEYALWEAGRAAPPPSLKKRIRDLVFRDENLEYRKLEKLVQNTPRGRQLFTHDDVILRAIAREDRNRHRIGGAEVRFVPEEVFERVLAENRMMRRREVVGCNLRMIEEASLEGLGFVQIGLEMTISHSLIDGVVVRDAHFEAFDAAEYVARGGYAYELITLDD